MVLPPALVIHAAVPCVAAGGVTGKEVEDGVARHFSMTGSRFDAGVDPVRHGEIVAETDWPRETEIETWTATVQLTASECWIENVTGTSAKETEIAIWIDGIDLIGEKTGTIDDLIGMSVTDKGSPGNVNVPKVEHQAVGP